MSLAWMARLTTPLFTLMSREVSARDLVLIGGGLFLLAKSTFEIHEGLEGSDAGHAARAAVSFGSVIAQVMLLDIVFSLDSVITAIGMANQLPVMIAAIVLAVLVMMFAAEPISAFVAAHPDGQDAGAVVPAADWHFAGRRRLRRPHSEGLYLLRDGVLGVRRDDQHSRPEEGQSRAPAQFSRAVKCWRQTAPAAAGPSESASRGAAARGGGAPRATDIRCHH